MTSPLVIVSMMRAQGATGVQTHVNVVRAKFTELGREPRLVTPFDLSPAIYYPVFGVRRLLEPALPAVGIWWYRYWHAWFLRWALRGELAQFGPCVLYAQCPLSAWAALYARASLRQRVVMAVHFNVSQADEWADKGKIKRDGSFFRAIELFESSVLPRLDGLVFVSDFMRRELHRRIPELRRVQSIVIPNFLDDPGVRIQSDSHTDLITVGTLEHRKNQRYALEIVAAAKGIGHRLPLTIVGDGPDRAMLESLAKEWNITDQVHFTGAVANAAGLMSAYRAYLHVARMENLPIVIIEAMARGLPVFATEVGGIPELFKDGSEGRMITLTDAAIAAEQITSWLKDPERMRRAGAAARERYSTHFEANQVAPDLLAFLDEVGAT